MSKVVHVVPDHAELGLPAAHHLLELGEVSRSHHTLHHQLVCLQSIVLISHTDESC